MADHPALSAALSLAQRQFPELYAQESVTLDRYLKQLLPFSLSTVSTWGESELLVQSALVRDCGSVVKRLSELRLPELLATVLESARPTSWLWGWLTERTPPDEHRASLVSARTELGQVVADAGKTLAAVSSARRKFALLLAALNAAAGATGPGRDAMLDNAISHRRSLLAQALQQADLLEPQLKEVQRQGADLSSQVSQLLTVTLPAIEMAQSKK